MSGHLENDINFRLNIDIKITKYRNILKIEMCGFCLFHIKLYKLIIL